MTALVRTLAAVGFVVTMGSCAEDTLFVECPFDSTIAASCRSEGAEKITCVVEKHPQCAEDICLAWKGSSAVCSRTCTTHSDCGDDGRCMPYDLTNEKSFCVPAELTDL